MIRCAICLIILVFFSSFHQEEIIGISYVEDFSSAKYVDTVYFSKDRDSEGNFFEIFYNLNHSVLLYKVTGEYKINYNNNTKSKWESIELAGGEINKITRSGQQKTFKCYWDDLGFISGNIAFRLLVEVYPSKIITEKNFIMASQEVTNEEFCHFLNIKGRKEWYDLTQKDVPIKYENEIYSFESALRNLPVTGVTWYGAKAYCEWVGGRLPTEEEWEYVATNNKKCRDLQCSDKHYAGCSTYHIRRELTNVKEGILLNGVRFLTGNVAEWVADCYSSSTQKVPNPTSQQEQYCKRILKGGTCSQPLKNKERFCVDPKTKNRLYGFRVNWSLN